MGIFQTTPEVLEIPTDDVPVEMPEANGFIQSSGKWWRSNPKAENINNLPTGYYDQLLGGKKLDWIRCYARVAIRTFKRVCRYGMNMMIRLWYQI